MSDTKRYHHGDLRSALLAAGESVLSEMGLRGFTLRECARRAGVSHAAPKHHFGGVKGFLTSIAVLGYGRLTERLRKELKRANTLQEEFYATTHAYVGFAEDYPEHFRIMFRADLIDMQAADMVEASAEAFTELTNVILRQRGEDEVTIEDTKHRELGQSVGLDIIIGWSHIHGMAHLMLENRMGNPSPSLRKTMMTTSANRLSGLLQVAKSRPEATKD